jgi:cysteinyl-tRNA synthetase
VTAVYSVLKAPLNGATKLALLDEFDQVLALNLTAAAAEKRQAAPAAEEEADAAVVAAIEARQAARKAKNFAEADRIRDELKAQGIELIDTPQGVQWRRV